MGFMKRAVAHEEKLAEEQRRITDRFASTVAIAASIIKAVRLARETEIGSPTQRVVAVVSDSIAPARMILQRILR